MRKLLAISLALTLLLTMSVAFAAGYADWTEVTINKNVTLTHAGTVHPAEIFNFTVGTGTVDSPVTPIPAAPTIAPFTITVAQGGSTGSAAISLPTFTAVGVYTYPITETAGSTAGMSYDSGPNNLVVTVINNPDFGKASEPQFLRIVTMTGGTAEDPVKVDAFENTFSAGSLKVTKAITGNYAVFTDEFEVVVTLTPPEGKTIKEGPITGGTVAKKSDGTVTVTFTVTNSSEVTIANIPYGVSYAVAETGETDGKVNGYTVTYEGKTGTINAATQTAAITNSKGIDIAVGVNLDNLPYILVLIFAAGGLLFFTMRKRFAG